MIEPQKIYYPLYKDKDKFIILITGGRGSGKSFNASAFIERLTFEKSLDRSFAHTILYSRYTMVSAHMSIIPEMMEKIEMDGTGKYFRATKTDIINRRSGGRIMFRGIKTSSGNQTAKLKSIHGITTFVCDEAEEWTNEQDFDKIMLSIRQKGIQNRIIIIMNPTDSNHFIYKKYIENTHKLVEIDGVPVQISTHPNVLHIHTTYFDNLDHLSSEFLKEVQQMKQDNPEKYAHTVIGRWADVAEGAVFKKWGIVDEFPIWCKKVGIGLDFGYSVDSTAAVRCGIIDNALYIDEIDYRTNLLSSDIVKSLRPWGLNVYADSADPRLIQEIHNGGVNIYATEKGQGSILAGIDKMKDMEVFVTRRSYNLQRELRNYVWDKDKDGNYINQPVDKDNHCFTGDTLIETLCGSKRIDTISVGDYVLTSNGYQRVSNFFDNGRRKILHIRIFFRNFVVEIKATPEHKFKTTKGWKQLKNLTKADVLYTCKSLMGKSIVYTMENGISLVEQNDFIEKCGNSTMGIYQKAITFTTRMKIHGIMKSAILNLLKVIPMSRCTRMSKLKKRALMILKSAWTMQGYLRTSGMVLMKARNGIVNTLKSSEKICSPKYILACGVEKNLSLSHLETTSFVQTSAKQHIDTIQVLTTKHENANGVEKNLSQTNIAAQSSVAEVVAENMLQASEIKKIEIVSEEVANVYDLEVENMHEFFANGVLVHNCIDAARYYVLSVLLGRILKPRDYSGIFGH